MDNTKNNICINNNCKNKQLKNYEYCKKHLNINFQEQIKNGMKICENYTKGCKNTLSPDSLLMKCQKCSIKIKRKRKNKQENITDRDKIMEFCEEKNIDNSQNYEIVFCDLCLNGFPKNYYLQNEITNIVCMICRSRYVRRPNKKI